MKTPRPKLLVVDDEPEVLASVTDLFRLEYQVKTFLRGRDALNALRSEEFHVIMSDQRMPEMNGVEFLSEARLLQPDATRLLFTGYSDVKAIIDAINQGHIWHYITKPWDPEELASKVRQATEQHDLIVRNKRLIEELASTNQRLADANRLKGAFIEVASHELKTPVAVVLGYTSLWKMTQTGEASPNQKSWMERIESAARRLSGTVDRMLKLLRADQLEATLDYQRVDPRALIESVVAELQPFLSAREQTIDLRVDPAVGEIEADAGKLGDMLMNLVVNAIKFTPDRGQIIIQVEQADDNLTRIQVSDPGVGIHPADLPHVFEPFFTGYDTLHHSSGEYEFCKRGIGLGLCLVKAFAQLHGGSVEVTSAPESGSTFSVVLPSRASHRVHAPHRPPVVPLLTSVIEVNSSSEELASNADDASAPDEPRSIAV